MFSKVEIAGIALSVTAMAAALYLVTKDDSSLALSSTSQTAEVGRVFVSDEGDQAGNLRDAIVSAADSTGNLSKLIVDDVIFGTGDEVKVGDTVTVHYIGTLQNGQEFDNSQKRGEPFTFEVGAGNVIQGWEEGLLGMKVGGTRILVIPSDMAYGDAGIGPIPGGASLVFSIELMAIQ